MSLSRFGFLDLHFAKPDFCGTHASIAIESAVLGNWLNRLSPSNLPLLFNTWSVDEKINLVHKPHLHIRCASRLAMELRLLPFAVWILVAAKSTRTRPACDHEFSGPDPTVDEGICREARPDVLSLFWAGHRISAGMPSIRKRPCYHKRSGENAKVICRFFSLGTQKREL